LHILRSNRPTQLGCGALFLWAIEPLLVSELTALPVLEALAIIFFSAFAFTAVRITLKKGWGQIFKQPLFIWVVGTIGICCSDFAYIYGARFAPIAHVELIDYIWPCMVIIFTGLLPKERFVYHAVFGALLAASGMYVLIDGEATEVGVSADYIIGYALAVGGACIWAGYSAFSRYFKAVPTDMIGMYCGVGGVISLMLHLSCEQFVMPSLHDAGFAIGTGIFGLGLAYQLWDYGVKFGHVYILGSLTYFARVFAMLCLVAFGKADLTLSLVIACVLSISGAYICSLERINYQGIWNFFSLPFRKIS